MTRSTVRGPAKILILLLLLLGTDRAGAGDSWPEFRGPDANGHADASPLPLHWSEERNVKWKTPIHDRGWSTPVVLGDQVWMTTATPDGKQMFAICVDRATGRIVHDRKLFDVESPRPLGNTVNGYASPSPVIEPGRVYVSFGSYGTACLDTRTGEPVWTRRDLPCNHFRGPASSPILFENLLIMSMDGVDFQYVVALDKRTGHTVWNVNRSTNFNDLDADGRPRADGDLRKAYNTPVLMTIDGQTQMISPGAKAAIAYDPRTGKEFWKVHYPGHSTASRTVFGGGLVFLNTGYSQAQLWAVRIGGRGDVTESHVVWKCTQGVSNRSSPVLVGENLYMCSDKGIASCLNAQTGKLIWKHRVGGNYSASLVYADGKIHFFSEEGKTTIMKPGPEPRVLTTNQLDDGFMASPAIAGQALYLRTRTHLYRIEE